MMTTNLWETIGMWVSEPMVRYHEDSFDTRVPCRQDAFSFRVTVREVWARPDRPSDLELAVAASRDGHRAAIRRELRAISRCYPPNASALLEHTANRDLGRREPVDGMPRLTCTCSFEVTPDEAIVELLQQAERASLTAEAGHRAMVRDLERLEQVEERWLGFLRRFGRDPLGPTIAQLAGSRELAEAVAQYAAQQEEFVKELRDLRDNATEAFSDKGLYEYFTQTDNAFSRLLRYIPQETGPSTNGDGRNGHHQRPAP